MEKSKMLLETLIGEIEKENPHLKKLGGLNDLHQPLSQSTKDKVVEFIKSARFSINPFVSSPIFKKVKLDFSKIYVDINFEYSVLTGVSYRIDPFIAETLDINISEYVFDAVEKLLPEKKQIIKSQWELWTIEQKINLLYELEKYSLKRTDDWLKENASTYFLLFENETRASILQLVKTRDSL